MRQALSALLLLAALLLGGSAAAQCNCPEIDSVAVGFYQADPDCVDAWFKHYRDRIPRARTDKQRRRYLRHAFLLKPDYPGILEQYLGVADKSDLRLLRDVLRCMLKNHELFDAEIVTYNLALAHAQYLLGDYGNAYQGLFSGITRDVFCRIPHAERKALICNNLGVLQLLYQGTNNMYREPVKPVSAHDIGTSIGMLDSALHLAPEDTVIAANRGAMPDLSPVPFNRYLCARKGRLPQRPDSARALQKLDSLRTAKYCTTSLFNSHYDELYARLDQYDELVFLHDVSGSMDTVTAITRGQRRIDFSNQLLQCLTYDLAHKDLGLISVGRFCGTLPRHVYPVPDYDTTVFRSEMACCDVFGETPLRERLEHIDTLFQRPSARKLAFLLTDGMDNCTSPFDLCEIAQQLFDKGIHLSILHLLPDAEEYDEITAIYHCMAAASRSTVYHLSEEGDIVPEPPLFEPMPYLRMPPIQLCADLDADGKAACRCRQGIVGCIAPDNPRWKRGNTWGQGANDPVTEVDCRIPRIPWQCKWGQRLPKD